MASFPEMTSFPEYIATYFPELMSELETEDVPKGVSFAAVSQTTIPQPSRAADPRRLQFDDQYLMPPRHCDQVGTLGPVFESGTL